jgi:type 1 fimbria pilin
VPKCSNLAPIQNRFRWYSILALGVLAGVAAVTAARAANEGYAQLTFSGVLSHAPCKLDIASAHQRVDFQSIPVKNFYDYDTTSRRTIIIRVLNCTFKHSQRLDVRFYGDEDGDQPGLLAVTGAARGFAIMLTNEQGQLLRINQDKVSIALQPGNNEIRVFASLKGANDAVKNKTIRMGDFHSTASFVLRYP